MRSFALAAALLVALTLAGCSGGTSDDGNDSPTTSDSSSPASSSSTSSSSSSSSSTAVVDYTVSLFDNRYEPGTMNVPNFQKVVFTNKGGLSHTVTIVRQGDPPGSFLRDQGIQPGTSADYNFPNDGTYTVYCRYHGTETSGMRMTITV